jgi:photosystem II stability/assembly factor-like uncharacterized protein
MRRWIGMAMIMAVAFGMGLATETRHARAAGEAGVFRAELGDFMWMSDVVAFGPEDIWAAGDGIVHFDGTGWSQVLTDSDRPDFHAIAGLSGTQLWAAGQVGPSECQIGGVIYRGDGITWQPEIVETHEPIYDLALVSPTEGWAIGGQAFAAILRYDGSRWRSVGAPEVAGLRALHVTAPDNIWAVGDHGAIVHFDGAAWQSIEGPDFAQLQDIHMLDARFGWAVGIDAKTDAGVALTFADGRWQLDMVAETPALLGVRTFARDLVIAVGAYGVIVQFDGMTWREIGRTNPANQVTLAADDADLDEGREDPVDGANFDEDSGDNMDRPDGGEPSPGWDRWLYDGVLTSLAFLPDNENLIAVGSHGQVIHIDDLLRWRELHAGRGLRAIDMLSADYGWIVGTDGPPIRWENGAWTPVAAPRHARWLRDIDVVAPNDVWAVGDRGTVMHWDGQAWTESVPFTWRDLIRVEFTASNDGWAFANQDTYSSTEVPEAYIYHYDGRSWTQALRLCNAQLTDIEAVSSTEAWFAAARSAILRFDGRGWSWVPLIGATTPTGPAPSIYSLGRSTDGSILGTGYSQLARFDGTAWRALPLDTYGSYYPTGNPVGITPDGFWGIGYGYLFYYAPGQPLRSARLPLEQLTDVAVVHDPAGVPELWIIGSASTVYRYRAPAADVPFPAMTPTPNLPPPVLAPTPTPHSIWSREQALTRILALADPDHSGDYDLERLDLISEGSLALRNDRYLNYDGDGDRSWWHSSGTIGQCTSGGPRPLWLARFDAAPKCRTHLRVVIDAVGGVDYMMICGSLKVATLYLPFTATYRPKDPNATPARPTPTQAVRNITPQPVTSAVGACPTATPYAGWPYP